jgi:hypothetical protein
MHQIIKSDLTLAILSVVNKPIMLSVVMVIVTRGNSKPNYIYFFQQNQNKFTMNCHFKFEPFMMV